jgi:type IV pilus assembly protein PilA
MNRSFLMLSIQVKNKFKKQDCTGFTLIEILVVIVIVGTLSAVAFPSYLNQASKARSSEAKAALGSLLRSQEAQRLEFGRFASSKDELGIRVTGKYYTYSLDSPDPNSSTATATPIMDNLRSYASGIAYTNQISFKKTLCESLKIQGDLGYVPAEAAAAGGASGFASCTVGNEIQ